MPFLITPRSDETNFDFARRVADTAQTYKSIVKGDFNGDVMSIDPFEYTEEEMRDVHARGQEVLTRWSEERAERQLREAHEHGRELDKQLAGRKIASVETYPSSDLNLTFIFLDDGTRLTITGSVEVLEFKKETEAG